PDGSTTPLARTMYRSHYGPVIALAPLGGWTKDTTYTFRNANEKNFALGAQWYGMDRARSLAELEDVNRTIQGIPWVNTMAVDAKGTALYMDASRTPNLSAEALAAYKNALASDPITQVVDSQGASLLDGGDSKFEWVDDATAQAKGIVPYSASP